MPIANFCLLFQREKELLCLNIISSIIRKSTCSRKAMQSLYKHLFFFPNGFCPHLVSRTKGTDKHTNSVSDFSSLLPQAAVTRMRAPGMVQWQQRGHWWPHRLYKQLQRQKDAARRLSPSQKAHCRQCVLRLLLSGPNQSTCGDACRHCSALLLQRQRAPSVCIGRPRGQHVTSTSFYICVSYAKDKNEYISK